MACTLHLLADTRAFQAPSCLENEVTNKHCNDRHPPVAPLPPPPPPKRTAPTRRSRSRGLVEFFLLYYSSFHFLFHYPNTTRIFIPYNPYKAPILKSLRISLQLVLEIILGPGPATHGLRKENLILSWDLKESVVTPNLPRKQD